MKRIFSSLAFVATMAITAKETRASLVNDDNRQQGQQQQQSERRSKRRPLQVRRLEDEINEEGSHLMSSSLHRHRPTGIAWEAPAAGANDADRTKMRLEDNMADGTLTNRDNTSIGVDLTMFESRQLQNRERKKKRGTIEGRYGNSVRKKNDGGKKMNAGKGKVYYGTRWNGGADRWQKPHSKSSKKKGGSKWGGGHWGECKDEKINYDPTFTP